MKYTINQDKIEELKSLDDEGEVLKELIGLFLPSTEKKIQLLLDLTKNPSPDVIKRMAHEMRSSCANLGAEILSETATELEYLQVDSSYQSNVTRLVQKLSDEFPKVKSVLIPLTK